MLMIFYGNIPMCASCRYLSVGTAHYSSGDQRICVCMYYYTSKRTITETHWISKCNSYKNSCNSTYMYNIIDMFSKMKG